MGRCVSILRELFARPGIIRVAGVHNAIGARLAQRAGFDCVWSSGFEISTSFAVPDANILTMTEFLRAAESIADAVDIPVIADCDTGYGNSNNVIHMVRKFEAAGIAAVCIEDKQFPKICSLVQGRQNLATVAEFVGKIMAAKNAQKSPDFMVIARTESFVAGRGIREALMRAEAYAEAGADAVLIHSTQKGPEEIFEFVKKWDNSVPLVVVPTTYFTVTAAELEENGVKMVIYANQGIRTSIRAMFETFETILKDGTSASVDCRLAPLSLLFDLQDMNRLLDDEKVYERTGMQRTRAIIPGAGDHMSEPSMQALLRETPISMLDLNGVSLIGHQCRTLRKGGITHIVMVAGYKRETLQGRVEGITLEVNEEWQETGELFSIMAGVSGSNERTLVVYADILFDEFALNKLLTCQEDITLLADFSFNMKNYSQTRRIDLITIEKPPVNYRRSLDLGVPRQVLRIGKNIPPELAHCEFAGLALFTEKGMAMLREIFEQYRHNPVSQGFHEAETFRRASLTDVLQELIDRGIKVSCVGVSSGWLEIRSFEDYRMACRSLSR